MFIAKYIRGQVAAVSDEEFNAYVGQKADRFQAARQSVIAGKDYWSWKLAILGLIFGLIVPVVWLASHRLWLYSCICLIVWVGLMFKADGYILAAILGAFFGGLLYNFYISDATWKISKIKARASSEGARMEALTLHGAQASNARLPIFFSCLAVSLGLGAAALSVSYEEGLGIGELFSSNSTPDCNSPAALVNIQKAAPKVIDIFTPVEIPLNMSESGEKPYYRPDRKRCHAEAMTSAGRTNIIYKFSIEQGVSGKQLFTEVWETLQDNEFILSEMKAQSDGYFAAQKKAEQRQLSDPSVPDYTKKIIGFKKRIRDAQDNEQKNQIRREMDGYRAKYIQDEAFSEEGIISISRVAMSWLSSCEDQFLQSSKRTNIPSTFYKVDPDECDKWITDNVAMYYEGRATSSP